ncbi:MAG TPA: hypothetical protein VMI75_35470, partial [Polyangiaceae bacterium]|nr:hypothetical protein [Polyangiaceae bacterium]
MAPAGFRAADDRDAAFVAARLLTRDASKEHARRGSGLPMRDQKSVALSLLNVNAVPSMTTAPV